ncbi:MAG: hypothetical protein M1493_04365 [Firmicutes bacterium]|nr:hypothetical protein [Bacillota bacterium]
MSTRLTSLICAFWETPTGQEILHQLRPLLVIRGQDQTRQLVVPPLYERTVSAILAATRFTAAIYTQISERRTG